MKKTIKIVVLLALIAFFITGCTMKTNVGLIVSKDKKVSVQVIMAMDDEMIDYYLGVENGDESGEKTYTDEERWAYIESNLKGTETYETYSKDKYSKDGLKGYIYTLELGTIDDLSTTESVDKVAFDSLSKDSKLFIKNGDTYTLNIGNSADSNEEIEQAKSYSEYGASFDFKFYVTLPNKAISNNATTISDDKLTYSWDLLSTQDFQLKFKLNNSFLSTPIILCIIGAVLVIGAIIVICVVMKGKKKPEETSNQSPVTEETNQDE